MDARTVQSASPPATCIGPVDWGLNVISPDRDGPVAGQKNTPAVLARSAPQRKIALPEQGLAMGAACAGYQPDNASNITEDKDNIVMFQDPYFTCCGLSYHLWPVCSGVSGPVPWRHNGVPFLL